MFTRRTSSWGWGSQCRNRVTTRCSFFSYYYALTGLYLPLRIFATSVTAAGLFCLRLGGRDGCQSVGFWSLEERYRSTNNSPFSLFLSVSVYRAHDVIDSFIAPRPVSLVSLDCAFMYRPSLHSHWLYTLHRCFSCSRLFASFLWVFSRFLVSSPGASRPGRRRLRRLTSVFILRV